MNINQLNVIQNNITTFNELKKLYIYFDVFEAPTESFRKRHPQAIVSIFCDRGGK